MSKSIKVHDHFGHETVFDDEHFFNSGFLGLTGKKPFEWQKRLFRLFLKGIIPRRIALPTGSGKTSLMVIWLLAFTRLASMEERKMLPRRLVWIVDRRVVVDQATEEAQNIRQKMCHLESIEDHDVRKVLSVVEEEVCNACINHLDETIPLAVSTLRGELADNQEWKKDPSKLGIIIGTVDMIGSRLLFSGYGDGGYFRPYHAGLLGIDALIVVDEAHLSPALAKTIEQVEKHSAAAKHPFTPMRTVQLTATPRGHSANTFLLRNDDEDMKDPTTSLAIRMKCEKMLFIHACDTTAEEKEKKRSDALCNEIISYAIRYAGTGQRVAVYVRPPKLAEKIHNALKKCDKIEKNNVGLLTGTIRGYERDQLEKGRVFKAFYNREYVTDTPDGGSTYYLVMTSAGEVGVNISADNMVCDLVSLESLIQRLGRVLRFGGLGKIARIDLVHTFGTAKDRKLYKKKIREKVQKTPEWKTLGFLEERDQKISDESMPGNDPSNSETKGIDVSPWSFTANPFPEGAYSNVPWSPQVDASHIDQWSMTSIPDNTFPQRRPVAPWLHGVKELFPETYLVWRDDVELITKIKLEPRKLRKHFSSFRILSHEKVKCKTFDLVQFFGLKKNPKVSKNNKEIENEAQRRKNLSDISIIVQNVDGTTLQLNLFELESRLQELQSIAFLSYSTLILPSKFGKLKDGIIDLKAKNPVKDVFCEMNGQGRKRILMGFDGSCWKWTENLEATENEKWEPLDGVNENDGPDEAFRKLAQLNDSRVMSQILLSSPSETIEDIGSREKNENGLSTWLVYLVQDKKDKLDAFERSLVQHHSDVRGIACRLADRLLITKEMKKAIELAAVYHDSGKNQELWQRAIGNLNFSRPLAKSKRAHFNSHLTCGYRHEFGSLMELSNNNSGLEGELFKHLIASHHKSGRPGFEQRAFDRNYPLNLNRKTALQAMERFFVLQKKYGWWGLAYLEAILKAADGLASAGYTDGSVDHEE